MKLRETLLRQYIKNMVLDILKEADEKRVYLKSGEKAPSGKKIFKGGRGGNYYLSKGDEKTHAFSKEKPDHFVNPNAKSDRYVFTVANNDAGKEKITKFKEKVKGIYKVQVRGRAKNRKDILGKHYKAGSQNDIPISKAQYLSIYIDKK